MSCAEVWIELVAKEYTVGARFQLRWCDERTL